MGWIEETTSHPVRGIGPYNLLCLSSLDSKAVRLERRGNCCQGRYLWLRDVDEMVFIDPSCNTDQGV